MRIVATAEECNARKLDDETLTALVGALDTDGYVVLGGVIDLPVLHALKAKLDKDTTELLSRVDVDDAGKSSGHLSQAMPPYREHIYGDVVGNPFVIQVTASILGAGVHNHFYNCNTNMPGSLTQPLHRDAPHLGDGLVDSTTSIVVNVSLVDVDEVNGATEVWPGTHRISGSTRVTEETEAQRRSDVPPVRVLCRLGDVVLRDPRLWHRGMPNDGVEARHMIAMVHSRWYYMCESTLPATRGALQSFDNDVLTTRLELVPDDFDYLSSCLR